MTLELGRYGVWRAAREVHASFAAEIERLGYGALWLGGCPAGGLTLVHELLAATTALKIATGIVNVWESPADEIAASFARIEAAFPGRFVLGIGIGHPEAISEYRSPYDTLVAYLDRLDELDVPSERVVLAALGPKVLKLSADRTGGAHPYLTTPGHTRRAREILGEGVLLAPEQKVVVGTEPGPAPQTRAIGRQKVENPYLHLSNYLRNLRDLGWTDADFADGGSDALIDALVIQGDPTAVAAGVTAHLDAGADHVTVQALSPDPLVALTALAPALGL
jgi:probable F420-dependent oxidoreductase